MNNQARLKLVFFSQIDFFFQYTMIRCYHMAASFHKVYFDEIIACTHMKN